MVQLVRETQGILSIVIIGAYLVGALFVVAGLAFVYLGATGDTHNLLFEKRRQQ